MVIKRSCHPCTAQHRTLIISLADAEGAENVLLYILADGLFCRPTSSDLTVRSLNVKYQENYVSSAENNERGGR